MMSEECAENRYNGYSLSAVQEENVDGESSVLSKDDENVDICDDLKRISSHEDIRIDLGVGDGQSTQAGSSPASVVKSNLEQKKESLLHLKLSYAMIEKVKLDLDNPEVAKKVEAEQIQKIVQKTKVAKERVEQKKVAVKKEANYRQQRLDDQKRKNEQKAREDKAKKDKALAEKNER